MKKKSILAILVVLIMALALTGCVSSDEKARIKAMEEDQDLIALQEEYGIEFEYVPQEDDSDFFIVIECEGFAGLAEEEQLDVFMTFVDLNYCNCYDDSGVQILSRGDSYTAEVGLSNDEMHYLYKNGEVIYSEENEGYEEPEEVVEEEDDSDYDSDYDSGSFDSDDRCSICGGDYICDSCYDEGLYCYNASYGSGTSHYCGDCWADVNEAYYSDYDYYDSGYDDYYGSGYCLDCGTSIDDDYLYCDRCLGFGTCQECGASIDDDYLYCDYCLGLTW